MEILAGVVNLRLLIDYDKLNNMQPHQERVVAEKNELDEKISKLTTFVETHLFSSLTIDERVRLKLQLNYMIQYSEILKERIENF